MRYVRRVSAGPDLEPLWQPLPLRAPRSRTASCAPRPRSSTGSGPHQRPPPRLLPGAGARRRRPPLQRAADGDPAQRHRVPALAAGLRRAAGGAVRRPGGRACAVRDALLRPARRGRRQGDSTVGLERWGPCGRRRVSGARRRHAAAARRGRPGAGRRDFARSARNVRAGGSTVSGARRPRLARRPVPEPVLQPPHRPLRRRRRAALPARARDRTRDPGGGRRRLPGRPGAFLRRGDRRGRDPPEETEAQLELLAAAGIYDFFDLSIGAPPPVT